MCHFLIFLRSFLLIEIVAKFDKSRASKIISQHNSRFKRVESQIGQFRLINGPLLSSLSMLVYMQVIYTTLFKDATGQHGRGVGSKRDIDYWHT